MATTSKKLAFSVTKFANDVGGVFLFEFGPPGTPAVLERFWPNLDTSATDDLF